MINKPLRTIFVVKSIAPAGKRMHELLPYQLGLFDNETQRSVDAATYCSDKKYTFYWKSPSKGIITPFGGEERNAEMPLHSLPIKKISRSFSFEEANDKPLPFVGYLGWDGTSACSSLKFECGKTYGLLMRARGRNVRDVFGRNFEEIVSFKTDCCDGCSVDEGCEKVVDNIIKAINEQSFYLNNYFFKAEKVQKCCETPDPFGRTRFQRFRLRVLDSGDSHALAAVQNFYPNYKIERVDRNGVESTYEVVLPKITQATLTVLNITASGNATINRRHLVNATTADVTLTIPNGSSNGQAIEIVNVGVTNNDVMYAIGASTFTVGIGDGVRLVWNGSAWISGNFQTISNYTVTTQTIANCDTCPTGFTAVPARDKYIITMAYNGSANALTTVQAVYPTAVSVNLLSYNAGQGVFEVMFAEGATVTQVNNTTVQFLGTTPVGCTSNTTQTYTWFLDSEAYKITRNLCMVKAHPECDGVSDLTNLIAFANGVDTYVPGSAVQETIGGCNNRYTVSQYNNALLEDGCDTFGKDGAKFDAFPSFEGFTWAACDCPGWSFDESGCPVAPETQGLQDCRCGIKFTGAYLDRETHDCYFNINHAVNVDPVTIEVSLITQDLDTCDLPNIPWTVVQYPRIVQGLGEFVMRDVVGNRYYDNHIYVDPDQEMAKLFEKRLGYDFGVRPDQLYHHFNLVHESQIERDSFVSDSAIREEIVLYVEASDATLQTNLKTFLNKTLLSSGVCSMFV